MRKDRISDFDIPLFCHTVMACSSLENKIVRDFAIMKALRYLVPGYIQYKNNEYLMRLADMAEEMYKAEVEKIDHEIKAVI